MKLPTLEDFLTRLKEEAEDKAHLLKRVMSPHRFPCPYCSKDVHVDYATNGSSYRFRHKEPGCKHTEATETSDPRITETRATLLASFVYHCRPKYRFAPLEGLENNVIDKENR